MFDLGTMGEILIIALAALILIGPKEMPEVLRALGRMTQKIKFLTSNLRYEFTKHLQDGELEEYTKKINADVLSKPPHSESNPPHDEDIYHQDDHDLGTDFLDDDFADTDTESLQDLSQNNKKQRSSQQSSKHSKEEM